MKLFVLVAVLVASSYRPAHTIRWARDQAPSPPSSPSLDDTLQWIASYLDTDRIDRTGIRLITSLTHRGCDVTLVKSGGQVTLLRADFNLAAIAYARVRTEASSSNVTGMNLILQTAGDRSIRAARPALAGRTMTPEQQSQLSWPLGSVAAGAENPYIELGQRLISAFSHAVEVCGGRIRKEPF